MVARGLKELNEDVAYVGGATVGLHIEDHGAPAIRTSDDVDCVVEITSQSDYHKLEKHLSQLGFRRPPIENTAPICRWLYGGISVDFMPTKEHILGFRNRWYGEGLKHATPYRLPDGPTIRIFTLPFLIATKIEAFWDRGQGDFMASSDMEDIVAVLDGAIKVKEKMMASTKSVKTYLRNHFTKFILNPLFLESLEGHLADPRRAEHVKAILTELVHSL